MKEDLKTQELSVLVNEQIKKLLDVAGCINFCDRTGKFTVHSSFEISESKYVWGDTLSEAFGKLQKEINRSEIIEGKKFFDKLGEVIHENGWSIRLTRDIDEPVILSEGNIGLQDKETGIWIDVSGCEYKLHSEKISKANKLNHYVYLQAIVNSHGKIKNRGSL